MYESRAICFVSKHEIKDLRTNLDYLLFGILFDKTVIESLQRFYMIRKIED